MKKIIACISIICYTLLCYSQNQTTDNNYRTQKNISYLHPGEKDSYKLERCKLDLHYPTDKKGFAPLIWFHGGGLEAGEKHFPKEFLEQGYAVIAVNYRLSPRAQNPAYTEDAAEAVAWTFENIEEFGGDKDKIYIAYCPERVLPGNTLYELVHNDRVIGGVNPESTAKAIEFYSAFVQGKLHPTNARTAEMCKLTENSSRDSQIAFANELSMICDKAGINVWELIELANKHPRVNILQPGCGVGGHCIAVDPWFIVSDYPEQAQIIKRARETNDYKADWCANKVMEACQQFVEKNDREPVVACMGLAFKPNIDDLRESPAKYIASRIVSESRAEVLIVEPNVASHASFHLTDYREAYQKADIVVWLVRHTPFVELPREESKLELDFCGVRK